MRQGILTGVERRRRWSDAETRSILAEAGVDGARVADVARRHDLTRQHIYQWRAEFRRDWLKKVGVTASAARLARVQGDSMQPTMWPGDMILIDTKRKDPQIRQRDTHDQHRSPVYAIIDNGEARVKRIERPSADLMMMLSDNPDYAPELRQGKDLANIKIIGKVVWWGHTAKE